MPHLSAISRRAADLIATATLTVETTGEGFIEITGEAAAFVRAAGGSDGVLMAFIRHTSASLVIQENADPDVQTDLRTRCRPWRRRTPAGSMTPKAPTTCRPMS